MNILFFGGTSYVADELINSLAKKNNVINISRKKKRNLKIKNIYLDLNNKKTFKNLNKIKFSNIDILFFFSSYVPLREDRSTWKLCSRTNVYSLIELLNSSNLNIKKIVISSSTSIYGQKGASNIKEDDLLTPDSGYALSKFAQEHVMRIYCLKNQIKFLSLRIGYVYSYKISPSRLIFRLFKSFQNNENIRIENGDKINLNLIHSKDLSKIILKLMRSNEGTFNVCARKFLSLNEYVFYLSGEFPSYSGKITKYNNSNGKMNSYSTKKLEKIIPNISYKNIKNTIREMKSKL